jgi:subtilase family serine protease
MVIEGKGRRSRLVARAAVPGVVALVAGLFAMASPARAAQSAGAASAATRSLVGSRPNWATARAERGATPAGTRVSAQVYLAGRNPAGLAAYAKAVSSPKNAVYHHYLSPARQKARFGPTALQLREVDAWLGRAGLTISGTTEQAVSVTGTVAAVRRAFGTQLRNYELAGHLYYAPSHNAVVPAAVAGAVLGVAGLDDAPSLARPGATPTPTRTRVAGRTKSGLPYVGSLPCSTYWGQETPTDLPDAYGSSNPWPVCGYTPNQLRDAYGVAATGLTGHGVTVAVVDAYGSFTMPSDANTLDVDNDFPPFGAKQYTQLVTPSQWTNEEACNGPASWQPEESLDIESLHTMAPGADVVYVGANSCKDSDFIAAFS